MFLLGMLCCFLLNFIIFFLPFEYFLKFYINTYLGLFVVIISFVVCPFFVYVRTEFFHIFIMKSR